MSVLHEISLKIHLSKAVFLYRDFVCNPEKQTNVREREEKNCEKQMFVQYEVQITWKNTLRRLMMLFRWITYRRSGRCFIPLSRTYTHTNTHSHTHTYPRSCCISFPFSPFFITTWELKYGNWESKCVIIKNWSMLKNGNMGNLPKMCVFRSILD